MRRDGLSLTEAAREAGTTPRTVQRHVGVALDRQGRRFKARPADRLARSMNLITTDGVVTATVRGSRAAAAVAAHLRAIRLYLRTGEELPLLAFEGRRVAGYTLETDLDAIDELGTTGELDFEDIYES